MQSENVAWRIPLPFRNPLFYPETDRFNQLKRTDITKIIVDEPFYFDMLYYLQVKIECNPWEYPKDFVSFIFDEWNQLKGKAREYFKQKDRSRKSERHLVRCVSLFIASLFWLNKIPVPGLFPSDLDLTKLKRKPVNCEERLLFILSKPTQYHAFVQLEQLFSECEKIFAKAIALKQI